MNKKILVVDDEKKIVEVIKSYLEKEGYFVIVANNGKDAILHFTQQNPDLVILDLMLPDITGEEICEKIRSLNRTPIIMLTAKIDEESILGGLAKGADDYLTKPFSPKQLVARVKAVLRRSEKEIIALTDRVNLINIDITIDYGKREVRHKGCLVGLTPTEYDILTTMSRVPNKIFSRGELIESNFNDFYEGFDRTIDTHIKNIRKKLDTNIIKTIYGIGYKLGGE